MQKVLLQAAAAASLLLASAAAVADPSTSTPSGPFIELGAGKAVYDLSARSLDGKSALSYSLTGGYRWAVNDRTALGVDVGYVDLGTVRHQKHDTFVYGRGKPLAYTRRSSLEAHAWTVGGTLHWQWTPAWSLIGRAGLARTDNVYREQVRSTLGHRQYWSHTSRGSVYVGVGVGYAISPRIHVSLNLTHYALTGVGMAPRATGIGVNTYGTAASLRF